MNTHNSMYPCQYLGEEEEEEEEEKEEQEEEMRLQKLSLQQQNKPVLLA